jgi:hypothetical protein
MGIITIIQIARLAIAQQSREYQETIDESESGMLRTFSAEERAK